MNHNFKQRLRAAFGYDRVVCRVIAAWCAFIAILLLLHYDFSDLSYAQDLPLGTLFLVVGGFFVLFSAIALVRTDLHTDSWALLLFATLCVIRWLLEFDGEKATSFLF